MSSLLGCTLEGKHQETSFMEVFEGRDRIMLDNLCDHVIWS